MPQAIRSWRRSPKQIITQASLEEAGSCIPVYFRFLASTAETLNFVVLTHVGSSTLFLQPQEMNTITFKFKVALQKLPFRNEGEPLKINRNEGEMMIFPCKQKLMEFVADIPALQEMLQAKMKGHQTII